ncbi:O-antigen ligase like membrane protein [Gaiella occulta]|uniref:O-antigen ligase like membrane protein n=1 Tax=Gaiella occulta TaxID=1002870 RepID=A0A7M2Z166_9ACTN|nr:O-antigen ligase family protein [Gaiella occulta]RDI75775.1 O-antigen ligase like membrane protein [Gaiella occulta]
MTRSLPRIALVAFVVGLALHNLAMAELWQLGVRGPALDVVAAWKDVLLVAAVAAALWGSRSLPLSLWADRLALSFAGIVVLYWLLPQSWLGGGATPRGELFALRHDLLPVGAYVLGRLLVISSHEWRRVAVALVGTAVAVTLWGLVDVYLVPLQWWRDSGVPGWFEEQLGLAYRGLSGLPENWVLNTGDEQNPIRRLVSAFLSPLASAYLLVVVLLYLVARRATRWTVAASGIAYAGLLWTHTRAAYLALAAGLVVLAAVRRRWIPLILAAASLGAGVGFVKAFPHIGPSTSYTQAELEILREQGRANPDVGTDPLGGSDASTASHLRNLRDGVEAVVRHPQGYGLGNAGVNASRTGVPPVAGESTYTEIGVDTGLAGAAAFVAWMLAVLAALRRRSAWMTAVWAAVLTIAVQTDVIGVHWIAYVVFALAGLALGHGLPDEEGT